MPAYSFPRFGVNDHRQIWLGAPNLPAGYPCQAYRDLVTRDLNELSSNGIAVRVDFVVSDLDTNGDGTVDSWQFPDALFKTFAQRGVTPLVLLRSASVPTTATARLNFAKVAKALVDRFKVGGTFWTANPTLVPVPIRFVELWNEANQTTYFSGTPQQYGSLLAATVSQVFDLSGVLVVTSGLAETSSNGQRPGQWLTAALNQAKADLGKTDPYYGLAGLGLHSYGAPSWTVTQALANFDQFVTDLSTAFGPTLDVWITEFGWRVSPYNQNNNPSNTYSEQEVLTRYKDLVTGLLKRSSGPIMAYNYRMNSQTWDLSNIDQGMGWNKTLGTTGATDTTQAQNGTISPAGRWFSNLGRYGF